MHVLALEPVHVPFWNSFRRYGQNLSEAGALSGAFTAERLGAPVLSRERWLKLGDSVEVQQKRDWDALELPGHDIVHMVEHGMAHLRGRFPAPVVVTHHDLMRRVQFPAPFPSPKVLARTRSLTPVFEYRNHQRFSTCVRHMLGADHVIAVAETMAVELCREFAVPRERVSVVYNSIGAHIQHHADAEEWLAAHEVFLPPRPRVLMVGSHSGYKNIELAIRAMATGPLRDATLIRAGDELTPGQASLAAKLGAMVCDLGHVPDDVLGRVYSACDALVQPSLWEGFGMPVAEAMAVGLPVVASDGGSLPEVVGTGGVVVPGTALERLPPHRVEAFAVAVAKVVHNAGYARELRERGLERAEAFRPQRVGRELAAVYDRLLTAHGTGRAL